MKQEITNTFNEGLIGDLNPLTTPSNVLTNCLNGTFITYNGNEFVLQNDMGNSKVDTARLPQGYIPVGIKEHGGIIYVASHNPITKKSQIGTFPSPQQLFNGNDLNVSDINFSFGQLVSGDNIPIINNEYYRIKLFVDRESGKAKTFHPGDKFILKASQIPSEIQEAYQRGVIVFKLGVITTTGNIDYIEDSKLKIYTPENGFWIFYTKDSSIEEALSDYTLTQVYTAKTSGELVLVIQLKTISAFNLIRKYEFQDSITTVTLEGNMISDIDELNGSTVSNINIGLKKEQEQSIYQKIVFNSNNTIDGKVSYTIQPVSIYGVLERLQKTGVIDFNNIKPGAEVSDEWRFYITDEYIKIGWSYDYFSANNNEHISKIRFTFLNFATDLQDMTKDNIDSYSSYYVDIIKDYYNGSFEEIFAYDNNLKKNTIYIVRIDRYIIIDNQEYKKSDPFYRVLYTGTYFNSYYNTELDFSKIQQTTEYLPFTLNSSISIKNPSTYTYKVKTNRDSEYEAKLPERNDFRLISNKTITDIDQLEYSIRKQGTYEIIVEASPKFTYENKFAGEYSDSTILDETVKEQMQLQISNINDSNLQYNQVSSLVEDTDMKLQYTHTEFEGDQLRKVSNIMLERVILSKASDLREQIQEIQALSPLYYDGIDSITESKLIGFKVINDGLFGIAGSYDKLNYNSVWYANGVYTLGPKVNGGEKGILTANIEMGNPSFNLVWGYKGTEGLLRMEGLTRRSKEELNGWEAHRFNIEAVDKGDNYILICGRTTNNQIKLINLGSRRTETTEIQDSSIIRADIMFKSYLSQMLVVKKQNYRVYIIGADSSNYVCHKPFNTIVSVQGNFSDYEKSVPFSIDGVDIQDQMNKWSQLLNINNNLPVFKIKLSNTLNFNKDLEIGKDIELESDFSILDCYNNAYSSIDVQLDTTYDSNKIYLGIPTGIADNNGVVPLQKDTNGLYTYRTDDEYIYNWYNRKSKMSKSINNLFKLDRDEDGYPIIRIISENSKLVYGYWRDEKGAPDMYSDVHFGDSRLYNEQ